jgi:hypothetical protein
MTNLGTVDQRPSVAFDINIHDEIGGGADGIPSSGRTLCSGASPFPSTRPTAR